MSHGGNYHTPPPTYFDLNSNYTTPPPTFDIIPNPNPNPDPDPDPPSDPCDGVVCNPGFICENGQCVEDPNYDACANVTCPPGQFCRDGNCVPYPRASLFDRSEVANMPSDIASLVNECMDKWERFIKPNAIYTTQNAPNGLIKIVFSNEINQGSFASMIVDGTGVNTNYPYQIREGTLKLGSGWSQLTTRADQLETILHELGHALGFACMHSVGWTYPWNGIPFHVNGLITPASHYANLLSLWNQKAGTSGSLLPINGGWINNDVANGPDNKWDAHWFSYGSKTVDGVRYQGVKNDIMCPGTRSTPEINIITEITLEHARTLGYEVIASAEGAADFTDLRSNEEYTFFGNCVSYE